MHTTLIRNQADSARRWRKAYVRTSVVGPASEAAARNAEPPAPRAGDQGGCRKGGRPQARSRQAPYRQERAARADRAPARALPRDGATAAADLTHDPYQPRLLRRIRTMPGKGHWSPKNQNKKPAGKKNMQARRHRPRVNGRRG